ncbi:hypothetical protein [Nostoc sp.]|uniref:hypothetical protein n=1 Tax=Nostoc sp. TaxID=1180 RepID=UPI002FF9AA2D
MSIDNWRIRTSEEKEQLREKICNLLIDGTLRNYKEIEEELGIKNVTFELDRLIHLEEIDFTFINGFRAYGQEPFSPIVKDRLFYKPITVIFSFLGKKFIAWVYGECNG